MGRFGNWGGVGTFRGGKSLRETIVVCKGRINNRLKKQINRLKSAQI